MTKDQKDIYRDNQLGLSNLARRFKPIEDDLNPMIEIDQKPELTKPKKIEELQIKIDEIPAQKRKRGRPPTGNAKSAAERKAASRAKKAKQEQ